ncbi:heme lyase CcmF/NrfE family subunit [Acidisoma cellulosilytica]|uniref:Heme lyase CcmF/NrfE family subunit n=1 Tax=Acidisoma cellulosilyticum TaxID=2802395 RepID=A0A964E2B0_9PROT|nr:heme lyase CcmF/NrfE family subunit [Acidisoma cellulosilyticum]MCB8879104.1 heme lyase CcmF/NrfE family subunit [Acidisoma cellulosilyticum]
MIPELGHFAIALAVVIALSQAIISIWGAHRGDARFIAAAPALALSQAMAVGFAFLALVWSGIVSDFSVINVAEYSSARTPLLYKITGAWGNHEGSILLWCLILSFCGAAVAVFGRNLPSALRARVIGVLGLVSCGFLLFTLTVSDPLGRIWPPPSEGQGVNPLLQDPGLAFHPPILYSGYVGFAVAFAFAVASLLEGRVDAAWGRWVRPWTLGAWCLLTSGIALGSWWSYYELGWGGYWFWDPVENASLLPWLTGTALLHSAIVVEKREALKIWSVLLAITTFSLSLAGTFMVRSGLLNSVHAFANDPTRGVFILALLGLVIGGSLLLFAWRAPVLQPAGLFAPLSREGALVLNNILLCSIMAVVLAGTMYPPFVQLIFDQQISVGPPFFISTVVPLAAPLMAAMGLGPVLSWKRAAVAPALLRLWWAALASLIVVLVGFYGRLGWAAVGFGAALWMVLSALAEIVERSQLFRQPIGTAWARLRGLPRASYGAAVAHAGLGVAVAGMVGMTLASHSIVLLHPGDTTKVGNYDWRLVSLTSGAGSDFTARIATLAVTDARTGQAIATMYPARRTFPLQQQTTTDVAIRTNGFRDLYAALGDERDGGIVLRIHVNPLAPWIWFGALIMAFGGALSLSDRRLRIGAPVRLARRRAADMKVAAE